jgi:hypothetical protein
VISTPTEGDDMSHTDRRELPESVVRMQGIRRSGAAGTHKDRRTRRKRSRAASNMAAIYESQAV